MSLVEDIDLDLLALNEVETIARHLEYEDYINSLTNSVISSLHNIKFQDCLYSLANLRFSHFPDVESVISSNKQLRPEIDRKIDELSKLQNQNENFHKARKLVAQEIKETHEALLMVKKYYKKFLKTYYTIETREEDEQVVFVQFFTETKKDADLHSIRLLRNKNGKYILLETNPVLSNIKQLNRLLHETGNLQSLLCCVRQIFSTLKRRDLVQKETSSNKYTF